MPMIKIAMQSAQSAATSLTSERLVNMFAEPAPAGSVSDIVLHQHPGMVAVNKEVGAIYGMAVHRNTLYVASSTGLYSIDSEGDETAVEYTGEINEAGTTILFNGESFYCSPLAQSAYLDGYFLRVEPDYAGRFSWAGPYSTTWEPLDFATAEGAPDALVGIISAHRELWLFGSQTTEIWYNAGDSDRPFQRMSSAFIERGAIGGIALVGPTPYWLGDDKIIYRGRGYLPERISTPSVERRISEQPDVPVAFSVTIRGHQMYVIRFGELCLIYDTTTQLWHERGSWWIDTWSATCGITLNGTSYVGAQSGLFSLDSDSYTDDGAPLDRVIVTPPMFSPDSEIRMSRIELLAQMGIGTTIPPADQPQASLQWSDDGGKTWSNEHWRNLGPVGGYEQRARWWRMGRFRQRCFRVRVTDPVPLSVIGMTAVFSA